MDLLCGEQIGHHRHEIRISEFLEKTIGCYSLTVTIHSFKKSDPLRGPVLDHRSFHHEVSRVTLKLAERLWVDFVQLQEIEILASIPRWRAEIVIPVVELAVVFDRMVQSVIA